MPKSSLYGKPRQLRRTRNIIARGLKDIATGRSSGRYPALDVIFNNNRKGHSLDPDTICTPDCPHRNPEIIQDIRPQTGERLAVVEHRIDELKEEFEQHRGESIRAGALFATKSELKVIDKHIDRDIAPAIERLASRSTLKTAALVVSIIGLMVSMAYNVINLYKLFQS